MHWARVEASALGSLIAACPAWKRREERSYCNSQCRYVMLEVNEKIELCRAAVIYVDRVFVNAVM